MKIKSGFMTRRIGDKIVAVAVGERSLKFNGMINLNETGEFIWKCLESDTTEAEIAQKLADEYEISIDKAQASVGTFVQTLKQNNLVEE